MTELAWLERLSEVDWPKHQTLTGDQARRINDRYSSVDMSEQIDLFIDYWQGRFATEKFKTWILAARLRTWLSRSQQPMVYASRNPSGNTRAAPSGYDFQEFER